MVMAVAGFVVAAGSILVVGPYMAATADRLSKATGLGGALFGVVFVALATDLPEVALTPVAVLSGRPGIAVGGLLGSAAAQLTLLAVVDFVMRGDSLYGRASRGVLAHCGLLVAVLAVPVYFSGEGARLGWVGLGSIAMLVVYLGGLAATRAVGNNQKPEQAPVPEAAEPANGDGPPGRSLGTLWARFVLAAVLLAAAGALLEATTSRLGSAIGLGHTAAGALLAGAATSLPELVTAVAAIRRGAIELAIGDLVGSSALDVALLALADGVYAGGSIFSLLGPAEMSLVGLCLLVTALLASGVARRAKPVGPGAPESYLMIAAYALTAVVLVLR